MPRRSVAAVDEFGVLQTLHEAALECLVEDRLHELTPGMRALTVLFAFCGEVDNGGFAACMYNSTGDWTGEAISAARHVGAERHAEVFERFATSGLGGDLSMSWRARTERLEAMSDPEVAALERLDDEFYALPRIDGFLTGYVDGHPHEFFVD